MPCRVLVFRWLNESNIEEKDAFVNRYARAREMQADALADDIMHIAAAPLHFKEKITGADGVEMTIERTDDVQRRRLQIDAYKWAAAKLRPKKWGEIKSVEAEETDITIVGGLPDVPVQD